MFSTKRCLTLVALAALGAVATAQVSQDKVGGPFGSADGKITPRGEKGTKIGPFGSADGKIAPKGGEKGTKIGPFDSADGKIAPRGEKGTKIGPFDSADGKIAPRGDKGTKFSDPFDSAGGKVVLAGELGYPVCFGDGTGMPCPFKNPGMAGRGCENSLGLGGGLFWADGVPRVSEDTIKLRVDFLPHVTTIFFLQSTGCQNDELGLPYGDGLMCMGGSVIRLGVVSTSDGRAEFPKPFDPSCTASVSTVGMIPPGGGERYYQAMYRDNFPISKKTGFNLTNAWSMVWAP